MAKQSPAKDGLIDRRTVLGTGAALAAAWPALLRGAPAEAQPRPRPMTVIDSQVHAYEANTPKRPWFRVPNWPAHVTGDEMVAAMNKVGVNGAIFISPFSMYQYDGSYAVEVQRAHPDRFAIVKPVNPDDPAVADVIADWKKTPGTVGIRIIFTKEANRAPEDPGFERILRAAVKYDFPVNVLFWGNVDAGTALVDRYPDTRFIIDHLAILQPQVPPAPPQPWADLPKVLELAKRRNAVIKVSGACTLSREPYPFPDIWDPLAHVFDAWGFERCLWGTDWTRAFAVVNYEQAVEPFLNAMDAKLGIDDCHRVRPHLAGAYRVVGGFCGLLHPVEDFVIGGPIGARREFAHLKGGHGGSGHNRAGDADRAHRQLRVGRR
jgi:L-fuconolactonase